MCTIFRLCSQKSTFFDYFQLYNRKVPDYRVCKFQEGNIIIPKITQIWRYLELNSTNVCIFCTLRKSRQRNAQIWVNMVIVMHKKYGKLVIVMSKFVAK